MSAQVALLTSLLTHGARMVTGSPDKMVNNVPVVRLGDTVSCPLHGLNSIVSVSVSQQTNTRPLAHVGAVAACGAVIITGSPNMQVG